MHELLDEDNSVITYLIYCGLCGLPTGVLSILVLVEL